jgi:hypothetical protein
VLLNFVALACLAEFDDAFLAIYDDTNLKIYIDTEFDIDKFRKEKLMVERELILAIEA